jgi:hypothetical protein
LDFPQRKSKILGSLDKVNLSNDFKRIGTVATVFRFDGLIDQPFALVETDRFYANACRAALPMVSASTCPSSIYVSRPTAASQLAGCARILPQALSAW